MADIEHWTRSNKTVNGWVAGYIDYCWERQVKPDVRRVEDHYDQQLRGAVERIAEADRLLRAAYADAHPEVVPVEVLTWLNPDPPRGQ